jgi:hypothetical protein
MPMTCFTIFPPSLKQLGLKIAILFNYNAFRFEAWFAGSGGVDSIVECVGRRVRLRRPDTMTSRIETATDEFVDDMERFLLDREMIS